MRQNRDLLYRAATRRNTAFLSVSREQRGGGGWDQKHRARDTISATTLARARNPLKRNDRDMSTRTGTSAAERGHVRSALQRFIDEENGQTATEYMLLVSVVVIAVVAAAYVFMPAFKDGVMKLSEDVSTILDCGKIGMGGACR